MVAPYQLSPVHRVLEELAPAWVEIDGWKVPARFGPVEAEIHSVSSRVGLCDLTFQIKWEFRGRDLPRAFPDLPPVGCVAVRPDEYLCHTTHEQALWIGSVPRQEWPGCVHGADRTSGFAQFLLAGPNAPDVLNRLSSLDLRDRSLPDLSCRCAPLAHIGATILRRDRKQIRAYEILVSREYGEYAWRAVWESGIRFGIVAFGQEARSALEG